MKIYTITVGKQDPAWAIDSPRCVGYYQDLEIAHEAVLKNAGLMFEDCYNVAVIEEVPEGIHAFPREEWWYVFDSDKVFLINRPRSAEGLVGFGIG